jgi:DNA-binding transcriptional LysR family regulator
MNLKQVAYFLAICEERNFTRAASRCKIRQPSLTAAIQRLEREIGGELFVRTSPTTLSTLGRELEPLFKAMHDAGQRVGRVAARHGLQFPLRAVSAPARS